MLQWIYRLSVAAFAALIASHAAAQPVRAPHIEAELIAATDAVVPRQPLTLALSLKHEAHWHTYWQVPGDSGLPTQIQWKLPEGWSAGPIQWPVPQRLPFGPLMNFGYEGDVLLLTELTPPAGLKAGDTAVLNARADWLVCKDVCIPGGADFKLSLPVRTSANPSRFAAQFAATRVQIPQPLKLNNASATFDSANKALRLRFVPSAPIKTLELFPLEEGHIEPAAPQVAAPQAQALTLDLKTAGEFKTLRAVLVANGGPTHADQGGWAGIVEVPVAAGAVAASGAGAQTDVKAPGAEQTTLWVALVGAFLGGLILNLMPCVFPVLSLKLLSLIQMQRSEDAAHVEHPSMPAHGGVFALGVVLSFVALAALLLALRASGAQLGWGFQMQTPWVLTSLAALFFLIGLNLSGVFEFNFGSGLASSESAQKLQNDKLSGSFWTGVLAVVVAAPCTAPFMGAALGYAITQPAAIALLVFAMLGIGMAAPYVVLTWFPKLLEKLPRPGRWMERFKQFMAFPMFGTAVWLFWILSKQIDADGLTFVLTALVMSAMAAWAFGLVQRSGGREKRWHLISVPAAAVAVYALFLAADGTGNANTAAHATSSGKSSAWQAWSRAEVERHTAAGKAVFVDFTAAWCVTCQANKKLVLNTDKIQQAFAGKNVVLMRADWTNRDAAITQELARFNRNGVPLYVLFDAKGQPTVLPELLTDGIVLDAVARL